MASRTVQQFRPDLLLQIFFPLTVISTQKLFQSANYTYFSSILRGWVIYVYCKYVTGEMDPFRMTRMESFRLAQWIRSAWPKWIRSAWPKWIRSAWPKSYRGSITRDEYKHFDRIYEKQICSYLLKEQLISLQLF